MICTLRFHVLYPEGMAGRGAYLSPTHPHTSSSPAPPFCSYFPHHAARVHAQTFASDVFSFGVIAYEVVTGVRAFAGVDRKKNIASLPPFPPKEGSVAGSTLWRQLQPLIRSCLEIEAADRPTVADILLCVPAI